MDVVEDAAARQLHLPEKEGNAGGERAQSLARAFRLRLTRLQAGALHDGLEFLLEKIVNLFKRRIYT